MNKTFAWLCILLLSAVIASAGPLLSIRLVEASNDGQGMGAGLNDVARLLQENLPFNSFRLLSNQSMPLPAHGAVNLAQGVLARCSGDERNLTVSIERARVPQLQSTVELRKDIPFILGGLPSANGKMIVILLVR